MGKSLWESFFLHNEHKARLMVHDEDHLRHDTLKLLGQAFAMACLMDAKEKDRKSAKDQRIKENMELHKEVERLQDEINCLSGLHEEAERLRTEKTQEASSLAEEKSKLLTKVEELKKEVTRKGEDLIKQRSFIPPWIFQNLTQVKPWLMAN